MSKKRTLFQDGAFNYFWACINNYIGERDRDCEIQVSERADHIMDSAIMESCEMERRYLKAGR